MTTHELSNSKLAKESRSRWTSLDPNAFRHMVRRDFWCFVELMFPVLHPGKTLRYADYLKLLSSLMMEVATSNEFNRVIINMPPRHMKSVLVSVFYVAWRLGLDPTKQFINISYGEDLANDLADKTRRLMLSREYRMIFPGTVLNKKAVAHITTTRGGKRYAVPVGGDVTGFGADEIIIDDPMEPKDAASEHTKEKIREWVAGSVITRFNNPREGKLILVMHRLAPDDLSSTLEPGADYVLRLPMVAEVEEAIELGKCSYSRSVGDILNESINGQQQIVNIRREVSPHVWDSQYQQRPSVGGTGMLSIDRFQRFDLSSPPTFAFTIHSWDVGATLRGAFSVCTKWGVVKNNAGHYCFYLIHVSRLKVLLPDLEKIITTEIRRDQPALVITDERGVGMGLYQQLRRSFRNVTGSTATNDAMEWEEPSAHPGKGKLDRFGRATFPINDGFVFIPERASWLDVFLYEIAAFPGIKDKDQVDSMTQVIGNTDRCVKVALSFLRQGFGGSPELDKVTESKAAQSPPGPRRMKIGDKVPPPRPRQLYAQE